MKNNYSKNIVVLDQPVKQTCNYAKKARKKNREKWEMPFLHNKKRFVSKR